MTFDSFTILEKLTIYSFTDATRVKKLGSFEAMFNPESYSLSYQNTYSRKQGINTTGSEAKYGFSKPEKLSLKLILDGNKVDTHFGIRNLFDRNDVSKKVQKFLELTSKMDGDIHQPPYLILLWGDLYFKCRLSSVNINYTQFTGSGIPLRAELDTEFFGDLETVERLKKEGKNSPDLTHYRIVGAHDRLPLMCKQIYGSAQYYPWVAKANNLDNFRNLQPGQRIYFPPIEK
ncbi:CIS tube protein [Aquimarina mytili]|uniref:LysM peptidoglycan-binding domain-containing protein n=1 Tax=Aquimarina mytili TaxID=874423 RepID=A0A936ZT86_9FLAO|nr:LysM peptidoglycan-binding domain-containing protein [Aquimarina mytili]MBL0683872.1 LysM peptidoglycan-binding domain-containing protein [Aquimarina mytili]